MIALTALFSEPNRVQAVFCKLLTKNEDSGRHGIVVPVDVYKVLPDITNNVSGSYEILSCCFTPIDSKPSKKLPSVQFKLYNQPSHSHPERRLTGFQSPALNSSTENDLFILGKKGTDYEAYFIPKSSSRYADIIKEVSLFGLKAGSFFLDSSWSPSTPKATISPELQDLLSEFDKLDDNYQPTVIAADKAVGVTFERLLGINENNSSRGGDFKGIEIKCYKRRKGIQQDAQDLFLKEPVKAINPSNSKKFKLRDIINLFGYTDLKGRKALKIEVSISKNAQGFYLKSDVTNQLVLLFNESQLIGHWFYKTLQKRLEEKLKDTAFIGANSRGKGLKEEFQYKDLVYCSKPSVTEFIKLLEVGHINLQLRMHIKDSGGVRNHGSQFRIPYNHLEDLFTIYQKIRG